MPLQPRPGIGRPEPSIFQCGMTLRRGAMCVPPVLVDTVIDHTTTTCETSPRHVTRARGTAEPHSARIPPYGAP
eukprot:6684284-Prymnesium_polylepis.1